jgi:hypothetical protein
MNQACEAVITTITPNDCATVSFVIPSAAEGSAVRSFRPNEFVIPTGARSGEGPAVVSLYWATTVTETGMVCGGMQAFESHAW